MKKFLALALCLGMVLGVAAPAGFAAGYEDPAPYWMQTEYAKAIVSFSNGKANVSGEIIGKAGTTKIVATFSLEKQNANGTYTEVGVWSNREANGAQLLFSGSCAVSRGNFRISVNANVTRNGVTENVSSTTYATY